MLGWGNLRIDHSNTACVLLELANAVNDEGYDKPPLKPHIPNLRALYRFGKVCFCAEMDLLFDEVIFNEHDS